MKLLSLFSFLPCIFCLERLASASEVYNFNRDWKLIAADPKGAAEAGFDDSGWTACTLPRAWNQDEAFAVAIDRLPTGIAWYRKRFKLPADAAGKKIYLEFEGIRFGGEFFLNGKSIGRSENGISAFGFDITDAALGDGQENVLAARIDNAWNYHESSTGSTYQWNDRNFNANYGGINKNVYLHITDKLHQTLPLYSSLGTTGVYVYASDIDVAARSATITAESQVRNDHTEPRTFRYDFTVMDLAGKAVKAFAGESFKIAPGETRIVSASTKVDGLNFWSWGYGYLYTVNTTLTVDGKAIDTVQTRTGFRKTAFTGGYLSLNDRPLQMHGYAQRTTNEWPALGNCIPAWVSDFSNGLMVKGNGNLVRWMHVTPSKQDVESCDRVGLIQAVPAGDSERDVTGRRWEHRLEAMRDAIVYNRNNPSVIFYECGNKGISEEHMKQMKALRDEFDPHGGRAIGSREMLNRDSAAEYGGEMLYINKSAGKPLWAMEYSRDEGLRKYWDEFTPPYHKVPRGNQYRKPAAGEDHAALPPAYEYNRNQDTHAIENVERWYDYWRERPGTGERASGGGVNIIFSDSNTHFRGTENYRRSGEVDPMRLPKDGFFAHRVMWNAWVDPEAAEAHILGHWNYEPGTKKDLYVVSSADKLELFLNGKSLGAGEQSHRFLFTFPQITWQPGTLRAVGYDSAGREVCNAELKTAGAPAAIRLTSHVSPQGLRADGADLALIDVEVIDAAGQRCPTALNMIHFDLTGPAEWRGGIAQAPDRKDNFILSKDLPVECGVNRVIVRTLPEAGTIEVSATADGLKPTKLAFTSKATPAIERKHDNLPPMLDRGPTPSTPAFKPTRIAIKPTAATAGSNNSDASATVDDDETTSWTGEGDLANCWIEYKFSKEVSPSEVTLKLSGWRSRSYPLRILVGDSVVYEGRTPRSLGYVTLPLKSAEGNSLRIQLTAAAGPDRDGFGMVEITGNVLPDVPATRPGTAPATQRSRGSISIIEAEFYEPVR